MKLTEKGKHVLQASVMMLLCVLAIVAFEISGRLTLLDAQIMESRTECAKLSAETEVLRERCDRLQYELETMRAESKTEAAEEYVEPPAEVMAQYMEEFGYDFNYVVRVVGAEARDQPFDGIMAVAQCIRTTAEKRGITPEQVVKIKNRYAAPVSESCTDNMDTVNEACLLVFLYGESAVDDEIEYFCMKTTNSSFHNSLRYVCTIGDHNYYAER